MPGFIHRLFGRDHAQDCATLTGGEIWLSKVCKICFNYPIFPFSSVARFANKFFASVFLIDQAGGSTRLVCILGFQQSLVELKYLL